MTPFRILAPLAAVAALSVSAVAADLSAQQGCPAVAGPDAEAGWSAYRADRLDDARARFEAALEVCPEHLGARTGLGYVELREGDEDRALGLFRSVVHEDPGSVDALVGLGLLAWRRGDLREVRDRFLAVRELEPDHPTAADYLARLPDDLEPDSARAVPTAEAADSAWRAGETGRARRLYRARLAADSADAVALQRLALLRAWEEEYDEALRLMDRLLALQPGNLDARIDRARIVAWKGDLNVALAALDEVLAEHPEHPRALEAQAEVQAWAGRYEQSASSYEELLGIAPGDPGARRARAEVLSLDEDFAAARAAYESLLESNPDDLQARLGLARVLTFAGRLDEARRQYLEVIERDPDDVRAWQGLGRARSWDGDLVAGEEAFRTALAIDSTDVTTLVGLGQNLRWQGRNAGALEVLRRAREISPSNLDVREQLDWVRVALGPQLRPTFAVEDDSDGNTMITGSIMASYHPRPRLGVRVDAYERALEQNALERDARGVTVTADYQLEPGWSVHLGLGGSENDGSGNETIGTFRTGVSTPRRYPVTGSLTFVRSALDATALQAETGVAVNAVDATVRWTPAPEWTLNGALGGANYDGTEDNTRFEGSVSVARSLGRWWSVGTSVRSFGFDQDLTDGYFDPDFYGIAELTGRWLYEPRDWSVRLEVAPGTQQVTTDGDLTGTFRASGRVAYLFDPGREVALSAGFSSAGLRSFSTGEDDYRYTAIVLSAAWVF